MNKTSGKSFSKFIILCFGGLVAAIGNGLTSFGLGVYVFEQTGSTSSKALISLLAFLPSLLLTPLAGVLADRFDRRLLMILGDGFSALGILFIFLCFSRGDFALWQIGVGVAISSIFSALVEPAFKATISDLLTADEYSKASGLVGLINSAKFLVSPVLAGILLQISTIKLLLLIDIFTIFLTVLCTLFVRKGIAANIQTKTESFISGFKTGFKTLLQKRGVLILTCMGVCMSFFIGFIQELSTPMILSFTDSKTLGIGIAISASGMLVSSLFLGMIPIKKGFVKILSISLFLAGIFMAGFGARENIFIICIFGFLFFCMLPFANTAIDYLIRTNIENEVQGRIWGLIGLISQFGYIISYAVVGPLADNIFIPLLVNDGILANSVGKIIGIGSGRGIGLLIITSGLLLSLTAIVVYRQKSIHALEKTKKEGQTHVS